MDKRKIKIVIAAGGDGSRMHEITKGNPKTFLDLAGKPLISYQLEFFEDLGLTKILLSFNNNNQVEWFKRLLNDKSVPLLDYSFGLHSAFDHPGKLFTSTDTIKFAKNCDILYSQGDVIFEKSLLLKMLEAFKKHKCIVINKGKPRKTDRLEYLIKDNIIAGKVTVKPGETTWRDGGIYLVPRSEQELWLNTYKKNPPMTPQLFNKCLAENKKIYIVDYKGIFININTAADYKEAIKFINKENLAKV